MPIKPRLFLGVMKKGYKYTVNEGVRITAAFDYPIKGNIKHQQGRKAGYFS